MWPFKRRRAPEGSYEALVGKPSKQKDYHCYICGSKFTSASVVVGINKETGEPMKKYLKQDVYLVHEFHIDDW